MAFKKSRKVEVLIGCRNGRDAGTARNHVIDISELVPTVPAWFLICTSFVSQQ